MGPSAATGPIHEVIRGSQSKCQRAWWACKVAGVLGVRQHGVNAERCFIVCVAGIVAIRQLSRQMQPYMLIWARRCQRLSILEVVGSTAIYFTPNVTLYTVRVIMQHKCSFAYRVSTYTPANPSASQYSFHSNNTPLPIFTSKPWSIKHIETCCLQQSGRMTRSVRALALTICQKNT